MHGLPEAEPARRNTPPSPEAAPLASLLFRSGDFKGRRLPIKVPVVNIGRGDYNDIVIADPSVSTMHAKLQRREEVWILTDLGSTNGTFVEGERLSGEVPLSPGTTLRFGDVIALFEPLDDKVPVARTRQHSHHGPARAGRAGGEARRRRRPNATAARGGPSGRSTPAPRVPRQSW